MEGLARNAVIIAQTDYDDYNDYNYYYYCLFAISTGYRQHAIGDRGKVENIEYQEIA